MVDVALGTLLIFLILTLIGIGPALLIFKNSFEVCLAIAPTVGLVLTTLIGTYLVSCNFPVNTWAIAWLIVGTVISLAIALFVRKNSLLSSRNNLYKNNSRRDRESAQRDVEKPAIATASRSEAVRGVKSLWAACCHSF